MRVMFDFTVITLWLFKTTHMTTNRVSICVPLYNGSRYLNECLESIAGQTFSDFEVLIVDDCSTDDGCEIARTWASRDPRFKLHMNEANLGLVGNWNRCIELARGEWLKFLFQDDLMEPSCLAKMLERGETGGGFVACARSVIYEEPVDLELQTWYGHHERTLARLYSGLSSFTPSEYCRVKLSALELNIVGEPSVTMVRRALFQQFGSFDPLLVQLCDSEMWNRLGCNVGVNLVAEKLVSFRVHGGSATQANQRRRFRAGTLDEIVELTRLFRAPLLAPFQDHLATANQRGAFRRKIMRLTNAAFEEARVAQAAGDGSLTREMNEVLAQLPGHRLARFAHLLYSFRRSYRSHFARQAEHEG